MAYQVVDAAGRVLHLEDDEIVPDGCSLRVSTGSWTARSARSCRTASSSKRSATRTRRSRTGSARGCAVTGCLWRCPTAWLTARISTQGCGLRRHEEAVVWRVEGAARAQTGRSEVVAAMSSWTGWQKPRPRAAGPWLPDGKVQPEWVRPTGGMTPSVGPTGRSPFLRTTKDAREEAYRRMVDRVSNAWRTHRTRSGGGT